MVRLRSIVGRAIALHLAAIVVTSIFMPLALYLMLRQAANDLHERALREQAGVGVDRPDGRLHHLTAAG